MKLSDFDKSDLIKLSIAGGAVLIAIILLLLNWNNLFGRPQNNLVAFFQISRNYGVNFRQPIGPDNPVNLKSIHNTLTYKFADLDGQLFIIQHPDDPTMAPRIFYRADRTRTRPPAWVVRLKRIGDPCKEALTMAAMRGGWMIRHWLRVANAPRVLMTQVNGIVATHQSNLALLTQRQQQGLFAPGSLKRIEILVAEFNKMPGDPLKDAQRQAKAREIMDDGQAYAKRFQARRDKLLVQEVDSIDNLLSTKQQNRIAAAMTRFMARFN